MRSQPFRSRPGLRLAVAALVLIASAVAVTTATGFDPDFDVDRSGAAILPRVVPGRSATIIEVESRPVGQPIQPGFIGLSLEYTTIEAYAGTDPGKTDSVFVELIRGLAPGQRPVLRIGGDSTDWAWWPVPHTRRPVGIRIVLGTRFGAVLRALAHTLHARLVLGINLEADSRRLAAYEATRLIQAVGTRSIEALELGNEPELYGNWPWRIEPGGRRVMARAADWGPAAYLGDFRSVAGGLPRVGLAGPALGGPKWIRRLGQFIASEPGLTLATVHSYPLQACYTPLVAVTYPTFAHMLAPAASDGLADRLAASIRVAHSRGLPIRVDEINSVSCGGAAGISNTFASALWALDTMFALARAGADGVNLHTFQTAKYRLFAITRRHGRWRATVAPEYYGLLLFARAAPPGSRFLGVSGGGSALRVWALRTPAGAIHVVLINDGARSRVAVVRAGGLPWLAGYEALRAPDIRATRGVSLGGAGFGAATGTGVLRPPRRMLVRPVAGAFVVRVPAASAIMLTLPARS